MADDALDGGCACGAVRFTVRGAPRRVGLCHCLTCRKSHGAAFNPFAVFPRDEVELGGALRHWRTETGFEQGFCPLCGSPVTGHTPGSDEIELSLGSFDEVGLFQPEYESWTIRREPWLTPLDVTQNERDP